LEIAKTVITFRCHVELRETPDFSSLSDLRFPSATRHILALFASHLQQSKIPKTVMTFPCHAEGGLSAASSSFEMTMVIIFKKGNHRQHNSSLA
jgi:hypothetical protein